MEDLKLMFDYQRFEKDPELEKMINEAHRSRLVRLRDEDLEFVNAAGAIYSDGPTDNGGAVYNEGRCTGLTTAPELPAVNAAGPSDAGAIYNDIPADTGGVADFLKKI